MQQPDGTATATPSSYRWVVVLAFWGMAEAASLVTMSLGVMLPAMSKELSLSPTQGASLASIYWMAMGVLSIPFSTWFSRYSPKRVITISIFVSGLFAILQAWAPSYEIMLAARFGFVIALAARTGVFAMIIQQWFQTREVTMVQGISSGLGGIAQAFAVILTPFWMGYVGGWRGALLTYGLLLFVTGVNWHFLGRERLTEAYLNRLRSQKRTPIRSVVKYKELWLVGLGFAGTILGWTAFYTFWPTYLLEQRGIPLTTGGFLLGFLPLGSIVGGFSSAFVINKLGYKKPILLASSIGAMLTRVGMLSSDSMPFLAAMAFLQGIIIYIPLPIMQTIPYELKGIRPREVAVGGALVSTVLMVGSTAGPMVAGSIFQITGTLHTALLVTCFTSLTLWLPGIFLPETGWRGRRKEAEETPIPDSAS